MLNAIINHQFMQYAVIASVLASIVCGIIGVIVVEKKLIMMSGGIAHTAYGGVGLGYLLGFEPMIGAVAVSVAAAFGIGALKRRGGSGADVAIALFWSLGMALGIIFCGLSSGEQPNMESYLFGNIISVTTGDLVMMAALSVVVCAVIFVFFNDWKRYLFDSRFAKVRGMNTTVFEYTLLVLTALTVVVLIRVAGIILVISLLAAPAATAAMFTKNFKRRMLFAVLIGLAESLCGLCVAFYADLPAGASIILLSIAVYAVAAAIKKIKSSNIKV